VYAFLGTNTVLLFALMSGLGSLAGANMMEPLPGFITCWLCTMTQAVAREVVHRTVADDARARHVYSWAWLVALLMTWGPFGVAQHDMSSSLRIYANSELPRAGFLAMCLVWLFYCFYAHYLSVAAVPRFLTNVAIVLSFGCFRVTWSAFGQPTEKLVTVAALILAELLGFTARAHRQQAQAALEQTTHRVINHTAKRCLVNTSQGCLKILDLLGAEAAAALASAGLGREHATAVRILRQMRADALGGFQARH